MRKKIIFYTKYICMACMIVGIGFIGTFFFRRYNERQTQLKTIAEFEYKLSERNLDDHSYIGSGTSDFALVDGETLGILRLDRLKIKVSVAEGIDSDTLRISAGHFPGASLPGEGNFAIAGHSSILYTCLFNNIDQAVIGDDITVTTKDKKIHYIISDIKVVEPTDTYVIEDTNESIITIVTCEKFANFNGGNKRLIIKGIEV